jgi:hypothetical protein
MVYALLVGAARAGGHETHRLVSIGECDLKVAANDEGALSMGRAVSKIGYVRREGRTKCGATRGDVVDQRVAKWEISTDDGDWRVTGSHSHDTATGVDEVASGHVACEHGLHQSVPDCDKDAAGTCDRVDGDVCISESEESIACFGVLGRG